MDICEDALGLLGKIPALVTANDDERFKKGNFENFLGEMPLPMIDYGTYESVSTNVLIPSVDMHQSAAALRHMCGHKTGLVVKNKDSREISLSVKKDKTAGGKYIIESVNVNNNFTTRAYKRNHSFVHETLLQSGRGEAEEGYGRAEADATFADDEHNDALNQVTQGTRGHHGLIEPGTSTSHEHARGRTQQYGGYGDYAEELPHIAPQIGTTTRSQSQGHDVRLGGRPLVPARLGRTKLKIRPLSHADLTSDIPGNEWNANINMQTMEVTSPIDEVEPEFQITLPRSDEDYLDYALRVKEDWEDYTNYFLNADSTDRDISPVLRRIVFYLRKYSMMPTKGGKLQRMGSNSTTFEELILGLLELKTKPERVLKELRTDVFDPEEESIENFLDKLKYKLMFVFGVGSKTGGMYLRFIHTSFRLDSQLSKFFNDRFLHREKEDFTLEEISGAVSSFLADKRAPEPKGRNVRVHRVQMDWQQPMQMQTPQSSEEEYEQYHNNTTKLEQENKGEKRQMNNWLQEMMQELENQAAAMELYSSTMAQMAESDDNISNGYMSENEGQEDNNRTRYDNYRA